MDELSGCWSGVEVRQDGWITAWEMALYDDGALWVRFSGEDDSGNRPRHRYDAGYWAVHDDILTTRVVATGPTTWETQALDALTVYRIDGLDPSTLRYALLDGDRNFVSTRADCEAFDWH